MSDLNNSAYYLRRRAEEMGLADRAVEEHVRKIHLKLADHYHDLAAQADGQDVSVPSYLDPK